MNINKQARQEMAAQSQEEKHLQETMSARTKEEVKQKTNQSEIEKQARQRETLQRQQDEHLHETMLGRSQEVISDRAFS